MTKKTWTFLTCFMLVSLPCLLLSASSYAANSLGGRMEDVNKELQSFMSMALYGGILIGVVFVIIGIMKMVKGDRGGEGGISKAIIYLVAGALLIAVPTVLELTSGSLTGSEKAWQGQIKVDGGGGIR